jgi:hypothetical protein
MNSHAQTGDYHRSATDFPRKMEQEATARTGVLAPCESGLQPPAFQRREGFRD